MKRYRFNWLMILALLFTVSCQEEQEEPVPGTPVLEIRNAEIKPAYTTADVSWTIASKATVSKMTLEYTTDSAFARYGQLQMSEMETKETEKRYHVLINKLEDGKRYYVRCRAANKINSLLSNTLSFKTEAFRLATIQTKPVEDITISGATLHGTLTDWGADTVPTIGFCYAKHPEVTVNDLVARYTLKDAKSDVAVTFSKTLDNLEDNTTYYVRAFATNIKGTSYGSELSFTTIAIEKPAVGEVGLSGVTYTTAVVTGSILSDGGKKVTDYGVCYSTSKNPTTADYKMASTGSMSGFTCKLDNLKDGTTYHVRAYATNAKGTSYSEDKSFTTRAYGMPAVSTGSVTGISYTSAVCEGNVTDDGGLTVTERGICYSTSQKPTVADKKTAGGSGTGVFACTLDNLMDNTKYYVRAYATNSKGTSYGEEQSFTTPAYGQPVVTTEVVTNISYTSAVCAGIVTADGGAEVTERGVCYSTSKSPTVSGKKVTNGSGTGAFACTLDNLTAETTYYVRAYATNSKGTGYGEEKSFTTQEHSKPTVTTNTVTNISYTSAVCGGVVTDNGGAGVTERGVCYSLFREPTISGPKVTSGNGNGAFTCTLDNLSDGATYYVRAYATNSKGTSYGEQREFTTQSIPKPTVKTGNATVVSFETAVCEGEVASDGGNAVTEYGICYSATSVSPTVSDNKVTGGSGTGKFQCALLNLTTNTTYHFRAYATNMKGTAYGEEKTFTTVDYDAAVIYYTANEQLKQSGSSNGGYLRTDAFGITIDSHTFENGVGTIRFTDRITSIGYYAFKNCTGLTSVTIPYSITSIGQQAFYGTGLTSFRIPENVKSIEKSAFFGCSALTSFKVAADNPNYCDIDGVLFTKDKTELLMHPVSKGTAYSIPAGVRYISDYAFQDCVSLTSVTIPEGVTEIGGYAFSGCSALGSVTIPNSVTKISYNAFQNCSGMTSLVIGSGVTELSNYAFDNCTGLKSITCKAFSPPSCAWNTFYNGINKSIPVYVPATSVNAYKNASNWKEFTNIQAMP